MSRRRAGRRVFVVVLAVALLAFPAAALAFVNLPANGSRVDDDPAAGIDPSRDPGVVDAVGGSLVAGAPAVPWAIFEHETSGEPQVFVRAFKNGAWVTQGNGTVSGASSASPRFSGSLNFAQDNEAEDPSIDFAGPGRTVPWATWYEDHISPFGKQEILASRFDAATGKWVFAGQGRRDDGRAARAEHRRDQERGGAGGHRRRDGRGGEPGALGHVAGGGPGPRPDLRRQAHRPGHRDVPARDQARGRQRRRRVLLAAGGPRARAARARRPCRR